MNSLTRLISTSIKLGRPCVAGRSCVAQTYGLRYHSTPRFVGRRSQLEELKSQKFIDEDGMSDEERFHFTFFQKVFGVLCFSGVSIVSYMKFVEPKIPWHAGLPDWFDHEEWIESDTWAPYEESENTFSLMMFNEKFCKTLLILPWNGISRQWGKLNMKVIPESMRRPILGLYAWMYNVNLDEAVDPDLTHYQNLSQFFRRAIKPEVRPIHQKAVLVSPADGKVSACGPLRQGKLEQIKGCTYPVTDFLGPGLKPPKEGKAYFYCVIYLAPGDYHGFHSPVEWIAGIRRHFTGRLLSVGQFATFRIRQVHCLNERVVLWGKWAHGFFSMTAVGATNVGNIKITREPDLITNAKSAVNTLQDKELGDWQLNRGEKVGEFQLGSSIVLVFEAPKTYKFTKLPGETVKFGEKLGTFL